MKPINIGLLGVGTVGGGTATVLKRNAEEISRRAGRGIEITMVADLDVARAKAVVGDGIQVVNDARAIIANPDIDVVVVGSGISVATKLKERLGRKAHLSVFRNLELSGRFGAKRL